MFTIELSERIGLGAALVLVVLMVACAPSAEEPAEEPAVEVEAVAATEPASDATAAAAAKPPPSAQVPKATTVHVMIKKDGDTCTLEVGPRGVGVCKTAKADCEDFVKWRWIGSKHGYSYIQIDEKTDSPLNGCFNLATPGNRITDTGGGSELTKTVLTGVAACDTGLWTYKVTAVNDSEEPPIDCEMDPGVIIDQ